MKRAAHGWLTLILVLSSVCRCQGDDADGSGRDAGNLGVDAHVGADATANDATVSDGVDGDVQPPSRWLSLPDAVNARDVGGYAAAGGQQVRWRVLLRGGQLSDLTAGGCSTYSDLGVASVADLRQESERASAPAATCVTDISQVTALSMPKILPASEANYLAMMAQSEAAVVQLFALLADPAAAPVYVHCIIGRDRASFAVALVLVALGVDRATVLDEFSLSNDAGITVDEDHLAAVLDEVDARGGIDTYLTGLGVPSNHLTALRGWALH